MKKKTAKKTVKKSANQKWGIHSTSTKYKPKKKAPKRKKASNSKWTITTGKDTLADAAGTFSIEKMPGFPKSESKKKASRKKPQKVQVEFEVHTEHLLDKESQTKYDNACETKEGIEVDRCCVYEANEKEQPKKEQQPPALLQNNKFIAVEYDATSLAAIQQIAEALCHNASALHELAKVFGSSHVSVDHMLQVNSPAEVRDCVFSGQEHHKEFAMRPATPDKGEWGQALAGGMYNVKGKNKGFYRG